MKTSASGIELIKSFEGCELSAYKCPSGVWTIGYGHTTGVKRGQVITQAQADAFLVSDLARYEKHVLNTGLTLSQNQFDALVSFTYNCGNSNLKKLIKNRTLAEIADALLLYNKSRGKVLSGLVRRREAERELFLTGGNIMAVYIAHSSIDERGKASGGSAGDQTKKEVCIRTWYNGGWGYVLRIMNEEVRNQFANNMIDLANNDNVGYDQYQRNTLLTQAEKVGFDFTKITVKCECDCSSAITICLLGAIYTVLGEKAYKDAYAILVVSGNCATTRTLRSRMKKLAMITVTVYSSSTYTKGTSKAVYGDIYLKEGSHVVAYIADGEKVGVTLGAGAKPENKEGDKSNSTYTGNSIVAYLNSIGIPSDFTSRKGYASQYGITGYKGTAEQNIKLLNLMRGAVKTEEKVVEYYPKYTGSSCSIVVGLNAVKVNSNMTNRKKIAAANGIENYSGKASQNSQMLKLLKQGKLKKA